MTTTRATPLQRTGRRAASTLAVALALSGAALAGFGGEDFANERRPPVQLAITGVITPERVTVAPDRFGAGPIILTISNQTSDSQRVTLEGRSDDGVEVLEETAPINPDDAAMIEQYLDPGRYRLRVGEDDQLGDDIRPATLVIGPERPSSSDETQIP